MRAKYKRPFVRQEPQRQRQRLSHIVSKLYRLKGRMIGTSDAVVLDQAIHALKREKDRLLPPVPDPEEGSA